MASPGRRKETAFSRRSSHRDPLVDPRDDDSRRGAIDAVARDLLSGTPRPEQGPYNLYGLLEPTTAQDRRERPTRRAPGLLSRVDARGRVAAVRAFQNTLLDVVDGIQIRFAEGRQWVGTVGALGLGGEYRTLVLQRGEAVVAVRLIPANENAGTRRILFVTSGGRVLDSGGDQDLAATDAPTEGVLFHNAGEPLFGIVETSEVRDDRRVHNEVTFLFDAGGASPPAPPSGGGR